MWGVGTTSNFYEEPSIWFVIEVNPKDGFKDLGDKVKFKKGIIRYIGVLQGAVELLYKYAPPNSKINFLNVSAGDGSTLTGGHNSTLTGGHNSTLRGGNDSTLRGGNDSTLRGGDGSILTGGDNSTLTAGYDSNLTGGDGSILTAGIGSVVIIRYFQDKWTLLTRVITKEEANKPYKVVDDHWILVN